MNNPGVVGAGLALMVAANTLSSAGPSRSASAPRGVAQVVVSANAQGVLEPCSCQGDNGGGFPRRATALASLRPGSLFIEAGNLMGPLHADRSLYQFMCELLKEMGYAAIAVGPTDMRLGPKALQEVAALGIPLLTSNLKTAAGERIGRDVVKIKINGGAFDLVALADPAQATREFLAEEPRQCLTRILGTPSGRHRCVALISYLPIDQTRTLVEAMPVIRLVLAPPTGGTGEASRIGRVPVIPLPASGKLVVRVAVKSERKGLAPGEVEQIPLLPDLAGDPRVISRIRKFAGERQIPSVRRAPLFLEGVAKAESLVSDASRECGTCHKQEYAQWAASAHARAWTTLRERGADRRAECVGCHTTPILLSSLGSSASGIGCTTCHGDGFRHAAAPHEAGSVTRSPAVDLCVTCHTSEASPRFEWSHYRAAVQHAASGAAARTQRTD